MYQDRPNIQQTISNLFEFFRRDVSFDLDLVKKAYANSSISIHFLFIAAPVLQSQFGIRFQEKSEDIFSAFKEMATATGGFIETSANPHRSFQKALYASENYYLLYYSPKNLKQDGKFRNIKVKVKGQDYRVVHRLGYFAD